MNKIYLLKGKNSFFSKKKIFLFYLPKQRINQTDLYNFPGAKQKKEYTPTKNK